MTPSNDGEADESAVGVDPGERADVTDESIERADVTDKSVEREDATDESIERADVTDESVERADVTDESGEREDPTTDPPAGVDDVGKTAETADPVVRERGAAGRHGESHGGGDPSVVETIVVSGSDLVSAVESCDRNRRETTLRVTPPFTARMRARIHVASVPPTGDPQPIRIEPRTLIEDLPRFPGRGPTQWRERVTECVRERVTIDTEAGSIEPRVVVLGE